MNFFFTRLFYNKIFFIILCDSRIIYGNVIGSYGNAYYSGNYIDPTDVGAKNIRQLMDQFYQSSYPQNAAYWVQAAIDKRFKAGDQSLWSMLYGENQYSQNRKFFFNLIRRQINMICGHQRRNRKSTITLPLHDEDGLADDYNAVLKWCEERDGFQEYLSQTFENAVDCGTGLLHMYPDYVNDPISGDLYTDCVAPFNYLIDPFTRKMDLSDCNGIWRRKWVTKEVAKTLLPLQDKEIDKFKPQGAKDGRFPLQAELININTSQLFTYDEFYYRSTREATMIIDPKSGESMEWEKEDDELEDEMQMVLRAQPWLRVKKMQIPTVKLCICVGNTPLYHGPNLLGTDGYPMTQVGCYIEPDIQAYAWKQQGIIRGLRDAQYLYNSRVCIMEDILRSQINSGWVYPIDAVVDPKAFRQTGQGFLVPLKAGHTAAELQRIEPPGIPQSMMDLARMLQEDMTAISGVNEELLGAATDDKAGILSMLRQGAGLTTLQTIFDKLDYSQRLYGQIRIQAIRKNFSKGKIASILQKEADPRFFSSRSLKYSVVVEEGNYSATQRQTELQQLLYFRELGMPIPDKSIMKKAIITDKQEILDDMEEQNAQQQQAQQAQSQMQAQKDQADVMAKVAKSRLDLAGEKEKFARIDEIEASAEQKQTGADLDLVRMMIELEDMQLNNFRSSFEMAQAIKQANQPQPTQEKLT